MIMKISPMMVPTIHHHNHGIWCGNNLFTHPTFPIWSHLPYPIDPAQPYPVLPNLICLSLTDSSITNQSLLLLSKSQLLDQLECLDLDCHLPLSATTALHHSIILQYENVSTTTHISRLYHKISTLIKHHSRHLELFC